MKFFLRILIVTLVLVVLVELPSLLKAAGRHTNIPEPIESEHLKETSEPIIITREKETRDVFVIQPSHFNHEVAPHFPIRNK